MYRIKSIARRATAFGAAAAVLAAAVIPSIAVYADALNPLTERSLLLSSSAPGFQDTDGSGNSNAAPNSVGENYAPAGSGPNGKKTGQTFTFKTSTALATVKGFSLQYCTTAAGYCQAPGDNTGDARTLDIDNTAFPDYDPLDSATWDTRVPNRQDNTTAHPTGHSDLDVVGAFVQGTAPGTFEVKVGGVTSTEDWELSATNLESEYYTGPNNDLTGKKNYITITSEEGEEIPGGTEVQIIFRPSESIYITNPGSKAFFVKINTYSSDTSLVGGHNDGTPHDNTDTPGHTVIDGGVTVANVMTDSIHITTKVLETMAFSVGTRNRDTVDLGAGQTHGKCDPIQVVNNNRLNLGNPSAEYSLETGTAWDVFSYWRLSSNSSGGATVYYSGNTLANTVGDEIAEVPTETVSTPGTEQFGLGFVDAGADTLSTETAPTGADWAAGYLPPNSYPFRTLFGQGATGGGTDRDFTELAAQNASNDYDEAAGTIDNGSGGAGTAKFKFLKSSLTVPERIAQQNETVISCATAKMRYVANIGADTPAGVYTTKINYLAAPQY